MNYIDEMINIIDNDDIIMIDDMILNDWYEISDQSKMELLKAVGCFKFLFHCQHFAQQEHPRSNRKSEEKICGNLATLKLCS